MKTEKDEIMKAQRASIITDNTNAVQLGEGVFAIDSPSPVLFHNSKN
jgi:hypothetical protein